MTISQQIEVSQYIKFGNFMKFDLFRISKCDGKAFNF